MEKVNIEIQEVKVDRHTFYNKIQEFYSILAVVISQCKLKIFTILF